MRRKPPSPRTKQRLVSTPKRKPSTYQRARRKPSAGPGIKRAVQVKPKPKAPRRPPKKQAERAKREARRAVERKKPRDQPKRADATRDVKVRVRRRPGRVERVVRDSARRLPIVGPVLTVPTAKLPKPIRKELEGEGVLSRAGEFASKHAVIPTVTATSGRTKRKGPSVAKPKGFAKNVIRDLVDVPAQTPASVYLTARAGKKAAQGDTREIKKLAKDFSETSALYSLATGDLKEAGRRTEQRPVTTALEVSGAKALVGRGAGATMRSGVVGKKAKRAASTERKALKLDPHAKVTERRRYSRDVINKAGQVIGEKAKKKVGRDPDLAYPSVLQRPGRPPKRRKLAKRLDEDVYVAEGVRRAQRSEAASETAKIVPPKDRPAAARRKVVRKKGEARVPKRYGPAVYLISEGTVRSPKTLKLDLRKRLNHLDRVFRQERKELTHADRRANRAEADAIRGLLKDQEFLRNPTPAFRAARAFGTQEGKRQQRLQDLGQLTKADRDAALKPFAQAHMGGLPDRRAFLTTKQGRELTPKEIRAEAKRQGVDPAFITQRQKGNPFFIPTMRGGQATTLATKRRSGESFRRGSREATSEAMIRQAVESQGHVSARENLNMIANTYGVRTPSGKLIETWDEAARIGDELTTKPDGVPKKGHVRLVPLNVAKFREFKEKLDKIIDDFEGANAPEGEAIEALSDVVRSALEKPRDGKGRFILIPEDVARRWRKHQFESGDLERFFQQASSVWKRVVLTTASPVGWLTGNVIDLGVRSAVHGLNPIPGTSPQIRRANKIMAEIERQHGPRAALEYRIRVTGGGFFTSTEMLDLYRGNVSVPVLGKMWRKYYTGIFRGEEFIERMPQLAAAGKFAKQDIKRTFDSIEGFFKLGDKAIQEYVRNGHTNPDGAAETSRYVMQVVGRWGKRSPDFRRFLFSTGPFVNWLAVALRFVYVTLPVHHPVKTAIGASLYEMTDAERKKLGLTLFAPKGQPKLKDYQQGSIPVGRGLIRFQKFTSFGIPAGGVGALPDFLLPQLNSGLEALAGRSWTGDPLVDKKGDPLGQEDRVALATYFLSEGFVPFLSMTKRFREQGGSPHPTSTAISPKTWEPGGGTGAAADRIFNPFRTLNPVFEKGHGAKSGKKRKARRKGGGWGAASGSAGGGWGDAANTR